MPKHYSRGFAEDSDCVEIPTGKQVGDTWTDRFGRTWKLHPDSMVEQITTGEEKP